MLILDNLMVPDSCTSRRTLSLAYMKYVHFASRAGNEKGFTVYKKRELSVAGNVAELTSQPSHFYHSLLMAFRLPQGS